MSRPVDHLIPPHLSLAIIVRADRDATDKGLCSRLPNTIRVHFKGFRRNLRGDLLDYPTPSF